MNRVYFVLAFPAIFLVGCLGTSQEADTTVLVNTDISNMLEYPVGVRITVEADSELSVCDGGTCAAIAEPDVEPFVRMVQPRQSISYRIPVREQFDAGRKIPVEIDEYRIFLTAAGPDGAVRESQLTRSELSSPEKMTISITGEDNSSFFGICEATIKEVSADCGEAISRLHHTEKQKS